MSASTFFACSILLRTHLEFFFKLPRLAFRLERDETQLELDGLKGDPRSKLLDKLVVKGKDEH